MQKSKTHSTVAKSIYDMTREWRDSVVNRLDKLDKSYGELKDVCHEIKVSLTRLTELDGVKDQMAEFEKKIRPLEDFKLKSITVIAVAQVVLFIIWTVLDKFILKK